MTTATTEIAPEKPLDVHERFCGTCGYGIVVRRDPPECPMCRSSKWVERAGLGRWN